MENKNVVLYEDLVKHMNEKTKSTVTIKSCGQDIEVTPVISMYTFDNCVARIVDMLYDNEGNYIPNLKDFFIRIVLLFAYTNVKFPNDVEDILEDLYDLVYKTSFFHDVIKVANAEQVAAINAAVDAAVKYKNTSNVDKVNRQIAVLSEELDNLGKQFTSMLDGVSEDDVKKLMSAIENNAVDENKLMQAYKEEVLMKAE
jgi:hypothetical protein